MRRTWIALLFLSLTTAALAQYGSTPEGGVKLHGLSFSDLYGAQKILLSNYCRLDFEGGRLQPQGWVRFKPYTSMRENPDFTRVMVVTRFDIETPEQPSELLNVNYQVVGYYQVGEGYTAAPSNEHVEYRVQEQSGTLTITAISPETPQVSPRAALAWMTLQLNDSKTSDFERAHLKDAIVQLNRLLPHAAPASTKPRN